MARRPGASGKKITSGIYRLLSISITSPAPSLRQRSQQRSSVHTLNPNDSRRSGRVWTCTDSRIQELLKTGLLTIVAFAIRRARSVRGYSGATGWPETQSALRVRAHGGLRGREMPICATMRNRSSTKFSLLSWCGPACLDLFCPCAVPRHRLYATTHSNAQFRLLLVSDRGSHSPRLPTCKLCHLYRNKA